MAYVINAPKDRNGRAVAIGCMVDMGGMVSRVRSLTLTADGWLLDCGTRGGAMRACEAEVIEDSWELWESDLAKAIAGNARHTPRELAERARRL